jgi:hypothetical protein
MSFSDWNVFTSDPAITFTQSTLTPIVGSGSLLIEDAASGAGVGVILPDSLPHGFIKGRFETLFRYDSNDGSDLKRFGIVSMVTDELDPLGTASAYGFVFESDGTTNLTDMRLLKWTGGIATVPLILKSAAITPISIGSTLAMQFDWLFDISEFGGSKLIGRYKVGTNFTGLITVFDKVDGISPISVAQSSGIYVSSDSISGTMEVRSDSTSLYSIAI